MTTTAAAPAPTGTATLLAFNGSGCVERLSEAVVLLVPLMLAVEPVMQLPYGFKHGCISQSGLHFVEQLAPDQPFKQPSIHAPSN